MLSLMKANKTIATYNRLREKPLWRLLAAGNGPVIVAIFQTYLLQGEQSMPASLFYDYVERELETLRAQGQDFPQSARAYVTIWLSEGWLVRRLPTGASEEIYELSVAAEQAIHFVMGLDEPRTVATESRLTGVISHLVRLAEETDTDPKTRIEALLNEREKIDREIESIRTGKLQTLPEERALERMREIIMLAEGLTGDFRSVRDKFEDLHRNLRQQLLDNEGNRGIVLEDLFLGVDVIADSGPGRTFYAFWHLLMDMEQSATMQQALEDVLSRSFACQLTSKERRFVSSLTRILLDEGRLVHEVLQHFAKSLKQFVQSREYQEQRRLHQLLKEAQQTALALKEVIKPTEPLAFSLQLSSSRLQSCDQWVLYDPSQHTLQQSGMQSAEVAPIDLEMVSELVQNSDIDFRTLKANILFMLQEHSQASIGEILECFPATQGLGSVVGYMDLGTRCGIPIPGDHEVIAWNNLDNGQRKARIPTIYFLREKADELV